MKNKSILNKIYKNYTKRGYDILLSGLGILILSPVFLGTSIAVYYKLGSPIIFTQSRPGKDEKIFKLYKFRTMKNLFSKDGRLLRDEERITDFGQKLRATSLDELPELINIFKGDMSFVGPRPLLEEYLPLYNSEQKKRHSVRPGLTGLAQVNGRNALSWQEKFKLDVEYVNNVSFLEDLKILLKTLKTVILREGINSTSSVTMEAFTGNN